MQIVRQNCRPCVVAACFRTLWNGWPTSARMRHMAGAGDTQNCPLGCEASEDRIEHYLVCPYAWTVLRRRPPMGLGLDEGQRNL
eukprot:6262269-Karenia_brevis.AAC.1